MTNDLQNNAFALHKCIGNESHCEPAAVIVRDGHHAGTLFAWTGEDWIVVDLEIRRYVGRVARLAVVTTKEDADPDDGLNQSAIGCDLEVPGGEWIVDAEDLTGLQDLIVVLWEQD